MRENAYQNNSKYGQFLRSDNDNDNNNEKYFIFICLQVSFLQHIKQIIYVLI